MSRYDRLPDLYRAQGHLLRLHLDLTLRCPLRCPHCYLAGWKTDGAEMTTSEVIRVLEEARDLKVLFLLVSGGEPMLRSDFFEVLEAARRMRFCLHVKTTGQYLGRTEARRLARLAPIRVDLSIHGARAETHDRFVGMTGAFERTVAAFEALREAGVRVGIRTNLVASNVAEAREIETRFRVPGVDYRKGVAIFSRRDGTRYDRTANARACLDIVKRPKEGMLAPDPKSPICNAAATTLYVAPDGGVYPCSLWPQRLGNGRDSGGLRAALQSAEARLIQRLRNADRVECMLCALRAFCPFCPGESVAEGLSPVAPNRLACDLARLFAQASVGETA